jgi:hypothetical protein
LLGLLSLALQSHGLPRSVNTLLLSLLLLGFRSAVLGRPPALGLLDLLRALGLCGDLCVGGVLLDAALALLRRDLVLKLATFDFGFRLALAQLRLFLALLGLGGVLAGPKLLLGLRLLEPALASQTLAIGGITDRFFHLSQHLPGNSPGGAL